jgi:hypothetical protein
MKKQSYDRIVFLVLFGIVLAAAILYAATAFGQHNPSYSMVTAQHPDAYLRPDGLAGVRGNPPAAVKLKNQQASQGQRFPLNDPDIRYGQLALPIQSWNVSAQTWDFRGLKHIIEDAISKGKRIYLRPITFIQGTAKFVPEHFKTITRTHNNCTRTAVDVNDSPTWNRVLEYYDEFYAQIVVPYHEHLIGIDATWAGSIDGGQPSYAGHLCGGTLTSVFGFSQARLAEELQYQYDLWGEGMIGHLSPNTSDEWATKWFADRNMQARRQDSRPFRESRSTNEKADKFGWTATLDIYEITAGRLAEWTKTGGDWYAQSPAGGPGFVAFWGSDYPANVCRAFEYVKEKKGFIWPMSSYPSRAQEPEYYACYLDGADGANAYVPDQIEAFYDSWHGGSPPPPDTLPPPDPDLLTYTIQIDNGGIAKIETIPSENFDDAVGKDEYLFQSEHHGKISVFTADTTFKSWAWPSPLHHLDGPTTTPDSWFRTNGRVEGTLVAVAVGGAPPDTLPPPVVPPDSTLRLRLDSLEADLQRHIDWHLTTPNSK